MVGETLDLYIRSWYTVLSHHITLTLTTKICSSTNHTVHWNSTMDCNKSVIGGPGQNCITEAGGGGDLASTGT